MLSKICFAVLLAGLLLSTSAAVAHTFTGQSAVSLEAQKPRSQGILWWLNWSRTEWFRLRAGEFPSMYRAMWVRRYGLSRARYCSAIAVDDTHLELALYEGDLNRGTSETLQSRVVWAFVIILVSGGDTQVAKISGRLASGDLKSWITYKRACGLPDILKPMFLPE